MDEVFAHLRSKFDAILIKQKYCASIFSAYCKKNSPHIKAETSWKPNPDFDQFFKVHLIFQR